MKIDIKCREGTSPFHETYVGTQDIPREAKHNFFVRQFFDQRLNPDAYLLTHLQVPKSKSPLPGTKRQRKWNLFVCGWVSKERAKTESVYLPRGSLTERGQEWFAYRSEEAEFYNKNLNGLNQIQDLLKIDQKDIEADKVNPENLHLTAVDAFRITVGLVGLGILPESIVLKVRQELKIKDKVIPTVMHANQHYHLLRWLKAKWIGNVGDNEVALLEKEMSEIRYSNSNR